MSVYFDHAVEAPDGAGTPVLISWHPSVCVLAVGSVNPSSGGSVELYLQQGQRVEPGGVARGVAPSLLQWHPTKPLLGVGWETGEVLLLTHPSAEHTSLTTHTHTTRLTLLEWSANGNRLVAGDQAGVLTVWKVDARGRCQASPLLKLDYNKPLTCCIFRPPAPSQDVTVLARAAVSGDESALDMFNWKKSEKGASARASPDGLGFFISAADGSVYSVEEQEQAEARGVVVLSVESGVQKMWFSRSRSVLAVLSDTLLLAQFSLRPGGVAQEVSKVKLSGRGGRLSDIVWTDSGLIITASGEQHIRMWDVEMDAHLALSLDTSLGFEKGEMLNCVSFCAAKRVLAAGTSRGRVALWLMSGVNHQTGENKTQWKLQPPAELEGNITRLQWGSSCHLLAVCSSSGVLILSEQVMCSHYSQQVAAVQLSPTHLSLSHFSTDRPALTVPSDAHIRALQVTKNLVAIWNGKSVLVFEVSGQALRSTGSFPCESPALAVHEESLYTVEPNRVQVRTLQGTVKQLLVFSEAEGNPNLLSVCGSYLAVGTDTSHVRAFDLTRREAKPLGITKNLKELIPDLGALRSVKVNANGSQLSFLVTQVNGRPDNKVYFYDLELDTLSHFDFFTGRQTSGLVQSEEEQRSDHTMELSGRCPVSLFWDENEPRLFVCETSPVTSDLTGSSQSQAEKEDVLVVTFFVTQEHGLLLQDLQPKPSELLCLLALDAPYYYYIRKLSRSGDPEQVVSEPEAGAAPQMVVRCALRDFVGLENCEKPTRDAMLSFSFYLTIGDMDEAFKAIKLIKSEAVWENMARMCVKSRRLDVARVCLGNMGNARAARALREAEREAEQEAQVAVLATQLGMLDEAERLYRSCGRFDLLNRFYQAAGRWHQALETAETHDRIHLRTTYHSYATHLEAAGDRKLALTYYEKSDTHRFEVPRMLMDDIIALEKYIKTAKDKDLYKWWGHYLESESDMEAALHYYDLAQDYLSQVRVHCYLGNIQKASEIANETGNRAASYHVARQYEGQEEISQSVHFYTRAQAYNNAIRLCKENNLDEQLMNLALLSNPEDMMDTAMYYEGKGKHMDRAVLLYHKAGHVSKALELAFATEQFGALQLIAEDLNESSDPALLARCSDFFIKHARYEKAAELLVAAKKHAEALQLCVDQSLSITEELAERLTVSRDASHLSSAGRKQLLEKLADCCMRQGNYHLATKKYTQAGNKTKAMRALLKSGDTEKIVFFAGVSRQREIYVMAANYLQSLDWRNEPEIMKNIISFYTKGQALDLLAGFYAACAEVEIDDYQNYEKAYGALSEACKCLNKAKGRGVEVTEQRLHTLTQQLGWIKSFIQAQRMREEDPAEAVRMCECLLEEKELDPAVRVGDVYGFLIEHYSQNGNFQQAWRKLEELRSTRPSISITSYISPDTLKALQDATGLRLLRREAAAHSLQEDEEVEEDYAITP